MEWKDILTPLLVAICAIVLPVIGTMIGKLFVALLNSIKNPTIRNLAVDAVLWAEDKFVSKAGDAKLEAAIQLLMKKAGLSHDDAEKSIRAAYQNVFGAITAAFPKPTPPAA